MIDRQTQRYIDLVGVSIGCVGLFASSRLQLVANERDSSISEMVSLVILAIFIISIVGISVFAFLMGACESFPLHKSDSSDSSTRLI